MEKDKKMNDNITKISTDVLTEPGVKEPKRGQEKLSWKKKKKHGDANKIKEKKQN